MGLNPIEEPMIHRTDVQVRLAEAEGAFYHEEVSIFLYHPVIRKRAVRGVALVAVQTFILGDLVVVYPDRGVPRHGEEAVVAAVVQLVLGDPARPEALLKPLEPPLTWL